VFSFHGSWFREFVAKDPRLDVVDICSGDAFSRLVNEGAINHRHERSLSGPVLNVKPDMGFASVVG